MGRADEHAADVDADRRATSRPERVRGAHRRARPAAQPARDVEDRDPDQEREQEHEADHVGQLLGPDAQPRPEEPLERDHQHPAAIERRERQDVDDGEVGRQDARDVQRDHRAELPEDVADLGGDADRARTGGASVGSVDDRFDERAQAADDEPERVDRPLRRRSGSPRRRCSGAARPRTDGLRSPMPSAPCWASIWLAGRSVTGDLLDRSPSVDSIPSVTVSPAVRPEAVERRRPVERPRTSRRRSSTIVSPATTPAVCGRRAGLDARRPRSPDRRVAVQRDAGEDDEREEDVHRHAGDEDEHLGQVALRGERARIVGVLPSSPSSLHEAADRQPVERVERLALRAQDLGARREADRRTRGRGRRAGGR